jgi:hypothetical protein
MRQFLSELLAPFYRVGGSGGPTIRSGAGSPEGVVTAPVGSSYHRTDGAANTSIYFKESGTGNTGWRPGQFPTITVGTTAPGSPAVGDFWVDTN